MARARRRPSRSRRRPDPSPRESCRGRPFPPAALANRSPRAWSRCRRHLVTCGSRCRVRRSRGPRCGSRSATSPRRGSAGCSDPSPGWMTPCSRPRRARAPRSHRRPWCGRLLARPAVRASVPALPHRRGPRSSGWMTIREVRLGPARPMWRHVSPPSVDL